jgi:hypothetical protein
VRLAQQGCCTSDESIELRSSNREAGTKPSSSVLQGGSVAVLTVGSLAVPVKRLFVHLRSGRWTFAEERQLIALIKQKATIRTIALQLRRSDESVQKKLGQLGLEEPQRPTPSREQLRLSAEAVEQRERSARFRELAAQADDAYVAGRLNALAAEHEEMAIVLEARAKR